MKNLLIITCLLLLNYPGLAQKLKVEKRITDHSVYVKADRFEGVVFDGKFKSRFQSDDSPRFTPKGKDVLSAEAILKKFISDKQKRGNSDDQFISKNLQKYLRQYTGYLDTKGEKIIHVNFLWKDNVLRYQKPIAGYQGKILKWTEAYMDVNDGGHYYWQVKINLSTGEVFDYWVNGVA